MIIVDDSSTDNTYSLLRAAAAEDTRIKITRHAQNAGVAAARNTALDLAKGDYIAFLDSDDMWMADKLAQQYAFMEDNHFALTYTAYQHYQSDEGAAGKVIQVPRKMTTQEIYGNTAIACLTVMVNRKLVGDFHMPPLSHAEDQCTWQDILSRGFVAYGLQENLAFYRIHKGSLTNSKKNAAMKQWNVYRHFHHFPTLKSAFYFALYTFNALRKHFL